jgi:hypothetical protein
VFVLEIVIAEEIDELTQIEDDGEIFADISD